MTYPTRVRDHLMQLNRAVCIDYPESNVPWFHQKYVDELKKQGRILHMYIQINLSVTFYF